MPEINTLRSNKKADESHWIPISDLMSVLMMIFLFIAVSYMRHVTQEKDRIEEIVVTYNKLQTDLFNDLNNEFKNDLEKWGAVIDKNTLSIKFQLELPDILFEQGDAHINRYFQEILKDFFPRYINILTKEKYVKDIEEVRIEGHTSSEWAQGASKNFAYFQNMALSQDRTRAVLHFVMELPELKQKDEWLQSKVTANGLSSSKLIYDEDKNELKELSRRVEFRVRTNAERRIVRILEKL